MDAEMATIKSQGRLSIVEECPQCGQALMSGQGINKKSGFRWLRSSRGQRKIEVCKVCGQNYY